MIESMLDAGINDIRRGYTDDEGVYTCLFCGSQTEKGVVYSEGGAFYEAERSMRAHIEKEHGSVFDSLLEMDKRWTGLSEHQSNLLRLFYEGKSDADIQAALGIGSGATIRAHRFALKEKEKQAKVFLVLMELLKTKSRQTPAPKPAAIWPKRGKSTVAKTNAAERFFENGRIKTLDLKQKNQLIILEEVAKLFEDGRVYTEKEVNAILTGVFDDFSALRRYLVDYGFLKRKTDGSAYWTSEEGIDQAEEMEDIEETDMKKIDAERRKELIAQYKDLKTAGGVYQVRNTANGKVFVGATPNLKTVADSAVAIDRCAFRSAKLREEIKQYGVDAFTVDILEVLEEKDDFLFDMTDEVRRLEKKWLQRIQPYNEKGYN